MGSAWPVPQRTTMLVQVVLRPTAIMRLLAESFGQSLTWILYKIPAYCYFALKQVGIKMMTARQQLSVCKENPLICYNRVTKESIFL